MDHVMVTGAGGIIGGHLVGRLRDLGVGLIRAVDCKSKDEWYQVFDDVENVRELLGWAPSGTREDGLAATYTWVHDQVAARVAR